MMPIERRIDAVVDTILEDTEKKVFDIVQNKSSSDFVSIDKIVLKSLESIEAASKSKGSVTGVATGFYDRNGSQFT